MIAGFLDKNNFKYNLQQSFENCKYKKRLRFDFYIPKKNLLIEYDGKQHFETHPNDFFGGETFFLTRRKRDKTKNKFIQKNHQYKLLRISYQEKGNMDVILKRIILDNLEKNINKTIKYWN